MTRPLIVIVFFVLVALAASAQSNCVAVPAGYSITDLGTLGGSSSQAFAVNASGAVTGVSATTGGVEDAFLWTAAGGMQDLGSLGGSGSIGTAINTAGNVVGGATLPTNVFHAFLWTSSGGMQDLGSVVGASGNSEALGIDDHNRVVGNSSTAGNPNGHAVVWVGTTIHDLGTIAGDYSFAYAINNHFQVAGTSSTATSLDGFLWTKSGGFRDLGQLANGDGSVALALNDFGMIAGYNGQGISAAPAAVVWNSKGIHNIGSLGGGTATATGVNDQCQVVGYSLLSDTITNHAFIWTQAGGMQDLNKLIPAGSGWVLDVGNGINGSGQIVGQGVIQGQAHAFLLTPTP
jgi:probable HAF family extracellular repeat protein